MSKVCIIVATSSNSVIGKSNKLPWHLPADLRYFFKTTQHYPVVMGRKTYESIGHALPDRPTIVISRTLSSLPDAEVVDSLETALSLARSYGREKIFVVGGAEIYKQAIPLADRLYLTLIRKGFIGDAFFPHVYVKDWKLSSRAVNEHLVNGEREFYYNFEVYDRVTEQGGSV